MRRITLMAIGVLLAFTGSGLVLAAGVLVQVFWLPAETSLGLTRLAAVLIASLYAGTAGADLRLGLSALWTGLVATCFVPVCLLAAVGEAAQLRSFLWSAGGTGILTAALPNLIRALVNLPAAAAPTAGESRLSLLLFLVGAVAGTIYWLVAGVRTGGTQ